MEHKLFIMKSLILGLTFLFASFTTNAVVEDASYFACATVNTSCGKTGIICNYGSTPEAIDMMNEMEEWLCGEGN